MKRTIVYSLLLVLALSACAQRLPQKTMPPKRELRSAWVSTVWGIDWPKQGASAASQKAELVRMLDSLKNNNFNAINLQVRSMSDALYKSSYEPWTSYLTGTRGKDPGYDPLGFAVSECHKRGMEIHAWINPYRFGISTMWNNERDQEARKHLLKWDKFYILDPSDPWTIERIVNVCREVVTKYDVDGILYDDYFYPNGISQTVAAPDYKTWKNSGTSLSIGDWRRENVNRMVKAVYDMIQKEKPYVRYGISPAGVACTSKSLAEKYGIEPCPSGSDWQYNGIFSDPVAWLKGKMIDFIAPQVYWKIGFKRADFSLVSPWWCKVAKHFGRQAFVSMSIDKVVSTSEFPEWAAEMEILRKNSPKDQGGTIFWSVRNLYNKPAFSEQLCHYLKRTVYQYPSLVPIAPWRNNVARKAPVINFLKHEGAQLKWQLIPRLRYTVYAFPKSVDKAAFQKDVNYLLGMVYNPETRAEEVVYNIPSHLRSGYRFAVCALDRYGNEYAPTFVE
ncbi:MAG: family 10 glycosylhydrolase [Muribaculaceae bacterium]|nr:family 10 glycosylhydrolase [Muribaculaceae bacterium]